MTADSTTASNAWQSAIRTISSAGFPSQGLSPTNISYNRVLYITLHCRRRIYSCADFIASSYRSHNSTTDYMLLAEIETLFLPLEPSCSRRNCLVTCPIHRRDYKIRSRSRNDLTLAHITRTLLKGYTMSAPPSGSCGLRHVAQHKLLVYFTFLFMDRGGYKGKANLRMRIIMYGVCYHDNSHPFPG